MASDRKVSKLISQSFRRELTTAEAEQVDEHLAKDEKSRAFAQLSRLIHSSLSDIAVTTELGDETAAPGIPVAAKERLRQSVRLAVERQQAESRNAQGSSSAAASVTHDMAFAAALLQEERATEEQLAEAIKAWNRGDAVTLGEHLVQTKIITDEVCEQLQAKAAVLLESLASNAAVTEKESSGSCWNFSDPLARGRLNALFSLSDLRPKSTRNARQLVSRFTLIRKLGEGGLGAVWLARDEKLKRNVAIKEMNAEAAESPKAWQRFHREAEITGHLEHPNVVPLYQFGSDPKSGQPFYAMRFVGKRTLADAIMEYHERWQAEGGNALELHRLLTAFIGVCQAVAYAHSRGVIHRDLKPENVAIDNFGQVIVLDWGLAKLTDEAELTTQLTTSQNVDDNDLSQTLAGEVIGTPLYMAPEQASGELNHIDEKTDVYGLGATLFAILTGCAPHENSNTSQDGNLRVEDLLKAIAEGDTPTPSDFNANVPSDLEAICVRAMSRKRYARHGSASELADEVQRWMANRHHKQQQYDNMRLEGRELRANLQSFIRDLGTNVRFMANLPPIQGIIDARADRSDDEENVWRERLSIIYKGLLQANADFSAIAYCCVKDSEFTEIVRIERHSTDRANVRSVPRSRLAAGEAAAFVQTVMLQKPEEVFAALTADTASPNPAAPEQRSCRLSVGAPVFDEQTEEPFGLVVIECDLRRIIETELRERIHTALQVIVVDPCSTVWLHESRQGGSMTESVGRPAAEVLHSLDQLSATLEKHAEFVDTTNRELYATRLNFAPTSPGLIFVLDRMSSSD